MVYGIVELYTAKPINYNVIKELQENNDGLQYLSQVKEDTTPTRLNSARLSTAMFVNQ